MTQTASSSFRVPTWMWLLAAIALIATAAGIWRAVEGRSSKKEALDAIATGSVNTFTIPSSEWLKVQPRQILLGIPITGSLSALDSALVKARIPGELRDLQVREGDQVTRGQVIARVDATETEARFRQTKLQADAAQAQVTIAQRQHDNNQALVAKGFISDTALTSSLSNLHAAQSNYAAARAAQDAVQKNLDDTVLRSPINGQIAARMAQNGERVNIEAPIVQVVNLSALELEAQVPANDSAQVQIGQLATLQLRASNGQLPQQLHAKVVRINPSASSSNRAVPVYLQVLPIEGVTLRPGMYVEGFIHTGSINTLAVPLSIVHTDQPLPYVQTVSNGAVQHSTVSLGARSVEQDATWVAVQGLQPDQVVLTGATGRLPAGTPVTLQPPSTPPASSSSVPTQPSAAS